MDYMDFNHPNWGSKQQIWEYNGDMYVYVYIYMYPVSIKKCG